MTTLFQPDHHTFPIASGRWFGIFLGVFVAACCGTTYAFGIFSDLLQSRENYDQRTLDTVGTWGNLGSFFGIPAGLFYDRYGPKYTLLIAGLTAFVGFFLNWCFISGRLPSSFTLICMSYMVGANSATWFDTAGLVTHLRNFPVAYRGFVIAIHKAFVGLSPSILAQLSTGAFKGAPDDYLLALPILTGLIGIIGAFGINAVPPKQAYAPVSGAVFGVGYGLTVLTMVAITAWSLYESTSEFPHAWHVASSGVLGFILLSFLLLPVLDCKNTPLLYFRNTASDEEKQKLNVSELIIEEDMNLQQYGLTVYQALSGPQFWLLFYCVFCGIGSGLMVIVNVTQIAQALSPDRSSSAKAVLVSLIGVGSATGRILTGTVSERLRLSVRRTKFLVGTQLLMAAMHLYLAYSTHSMLYFGCFVFGMAYGSYWALLPALVGDMFGLPHFGAIYNCEQLACAIGSFVFATGIAGGLYDHFSRQQLSDRCFGTNCFRWSFLINAGANGSALLAAVVLDYRGAPVSTETWDSPPNGPFDANVN